MRLLRAAIVLVTALAGTAAPAWAQLAIYKPSRPAIGERYSIEAAFGMWNPNPTITISSDRLAAIGTTIDGVADLGITKAKFPEVKLVLRLATKHKARIEYIPATYTAETTLTRTVRFQGVDYQVGLPVKSSLEWRAYRVGYEYDALYGDGGFLGVTAELKYTSMTASLDATPATGATAVRAPVPAVGAIARAYLARNYSVTAEVSGFKLPENWWAGRSARYVDLDAYITANFGDNFGAQAGYRSLDSTYRVKGDAGSLKLTGPYVRVVVRF